MALKIKAARKVAVLPEIEEMPHDGLVPGEDAPAALSKPVSTAVAPCTREGSASLCATPAEGVIPDSEGAATVESRLKRKRLSIIGRHLPRLHCNNCLVTDRCPKYKAGYECAFAEDLLKRIDGPRDARTLMVALAEAAVSRAQLAVLMESMSGGTLNPATEEALNSAFAKLQTVTEMLERKTGEGGERPQGVVAMLFGHMLKPPERPALDVPSELKP